MTLFFGLFSALCLQMQPSESGKLGYIKGMGIWTTISGALVSIIGVAVVREATTCYYGYNDFFVPIHDNCVSAFDDWVWGVVFGTGLVVMAAGIYMLVHASRRFKDLVNNPAAPI